MVIYVSLLVCILGGLVWLISKNGKIAELGRIAFGCGLLAFLFQGVGAVLRTLIR